MYATPHDAQRAPAEDLLYVSCMRGGTGVAAPDFLAVVDAHDGRILHETPMPNVGDELHHVGLSRRSHLVLPGFRSSRVHVLDIATDARRPSVVKVIEPDELLRATGYTRPRTVHSMPGGDVVLSMLGDADGNGAGGFACIDPETFEVKGRWENGGPHPALNYDFSYQPRHDVLVSSEFGEPSAYEPGFDLNDVGRGRYGQRLHFWGLTSRNVEQTIDLGDRGLVPLELRMRHDPDAAEGFAAATLSSVVWRFHRSSGAWSAAPVIATEAVELDGWARPVPSLMTHMALSMDDRFLYVSNWLHGNLQQYDVSDAEHPRLTGELWLGGLLGRPSDAGRNLDGGPQMLQLSLDGRRLYVTNSLYSTWDNQFYPGLRSWLLKVECDPDGGMTVDSGFFVDFHHRPGGPARAHDIRLAGGDCTSEVFA